jgi:hypothetical protein
LVRGEQVQLPGDVNVRRQSLTVTLRVARSITARDHDVFAEHDVPIERMERFQYRRLDG